MYGFGSNSCGVPLEGPERAGVASAQQEEEEAVQQGQGQPEQQEEKEPRPAHEQGVAVPLLFVWVLDWVRKGALEPTLPVAYLDPDNQPTCACLPLATM